MQQRFEDQDERTVVPGMHGRFIHSANMTFVLWRIDQGAELPLHSHPHEQVAHMRAGELELVVDGKRVVLKSGDVLVIPPNVPHRGRALTEVHVMDAFAPVREDYRDGGPTILSVAAARST